MAQMAGALDDRKGCMERINLGNGKWPDDSLDALKYPLLLPVRPPFRVISVFVQTRVSIRADPRTARDIASTCLGLGPSPGCVALHKHSTRNGRSVTYVQKRSSAEDGRQSDSQLLAPIRFPHVVPCQASLRTRSHTIAVPVVTAVQSCRSGRLYPITSSASVSSPSVIPRSRFLDRACVKGLDRTRMTSLQNRAAQGSRVWRVERTGKRKRFDGAGFDEGKRVAADAGCKGGKGAKRTLQVFCYLRKRFCILISGLFFTTWELYWARIV